MGLIIGSHGASFAGWHNELLQPITWEDNDSSFGRSDQLSEIDATINLARFHSERGEYKDSLPLTEEAIAQLSKVQHKTGQRLVTAMLLKCEALDKLGRRHEAQSCFLSTLRLLRTKAQTQDIVKTAYDEALGDCLNHHFADSKRICNLLVELSKLPDPSKSDWKARFLLIQALDEAKLGQLEQASSTLAKVNVVIKSLKPAKPEPTSGSQQEPKPGAKPLSDSVRLALAEKKRWKLPTIESFSLLAEGILMNESGRPDEASKLLSEAVSKMQVAGGGSDFYILLALLEESRNHLGNSKLKEAMDAMRHASYSIGKSELEKRLVDTISMQLQAALESRAIGLLQINNLNVPNNLPPLLPSNICQIDSSSFPITTDAKSALGLKTDTKTRAALIETGEELAQLAKISRNRDCFDLAISQDLSAIAVLWACGFQTEKLADCWYNIGDSYIEKRQWHLAIAPLQRALALRMTLNPVSDSAFSAAQHLARAYRESKQYRDAELVAKSAIARACANAGRAKSPATNTKITDSELVDKDVDEFLKQTVDALKPNELTGQKRLADLLQQWVDVLGEQKRSADAIKVIRRVIAVKKADAEQYSGLWNDIWGLAWQLQASRDFDGARDQYSLMIAKYPDVIPKIKGDWYYYRALVQDLNNKSEPASKDFKQAAKYYREAINQGSDDKGWLDWIAFMEYDMKEQLQMKRTCPPSRKDYVDALPASHWEKSRMPIKIFIDQSKESGFGPRFVSCFKHGFDVWANIPDSYLRCRFVENHEDADVIVKRVEEYREIPPGSGGRTISFYKFRGNHRTKILDQVRILMFCKSYNGEGMAPYDQKDLCGLNMHEAGHAFGLQHSPHGPDVMYWKSMAPDLTEKDKESIRILYPIKTKVSHRAK